MQLPAERSWDPLTTDDLARLSEIAQRVLSAKAFRAPVGGLYADRLIMLTFCQGAAQHFIDGKTGVKDLDVWAFFRDGPKRPFPHRARWTADFGLSHLGRHPDDRGFQGRRVDVMGRSIPVDSDANPEKAVRSWLHSGRKSAKCLIERPVIGLFPPEYFGRLIWTPSPGLNASEGACALPGAPITVTAPRNGKLCS